MESSKKIQAVFFRTSSGSEPVRDWLLEQDRETKKSIGEDIKAVEMAWPVGLPLVRRMDEKLWEIRSHLQNSIARTFFTVWKNYLVLLHVFIKKDQKTPLKELELAKKRRDAVQNGGMQDE